MQEYMYKSLNPGEIRLLRFHPGQSNQQLSGSIIHFQLKNPVYRPAQGQVPAHLEYETAYDAISYHWGSDTRTPFQLIVDNSSVIRLTSSLHSVLQRVVMPDTELVIWVDAICINQIDNNSKEKTTQIKLMPDIYRIARRVQIHLGPEADNSALAIELLEHISEYSEYLDDVMNDRSGLELARERGLKLPHPEDERWKASRAFWRRPWYVHHSLETTSNLTQFLRQV
jgi:hypothetical protein